MCAQSLGSLPIEEIGATEEEQDKGEAICVDPPSLGFLSSTPCFWFGEFFIPPIMLCIGCRLGRGCISSQLVWDFCFVLFSFLFYLITMKVTWVKSYQKHFTIAAFEELWNYLSLEVTERND